MKRRGFLGLLGGAAVAGPGMVKSAASATMADMGLTGVAGSVGGALNTYAAQAPVGGLGDDLATQLAKVTMRSAAEHARRQKEQYINGLDPDLLSYRSVALHRKIAIQKKRDYWRSVENEKSWLQRRIDGIFDW